MYNFTGHILSGLLLLFFTSCSVSRIDETSSGKIPAPPGPGDCAVCHKDKEVLPHDHVDTGNMTGEECNSCHKPRNTSLRTKIPLGHIHQLGGVSCKACHEDPAFPEAVESKMCKKCHSDEEELIAAVNKLDINPHYSPHDGKIPDCNKCHHQHRSSENFCFKCHGMEYKVP